MYKVRWDEDALKDLKAIDRAMAIKLVNKVDNFLCKSPLKLGKALSGDFKGLYRYRFGDYRIIYEVNDSEITVIVVRVGHRRDVYV